MPKHVWFAITNLGDTSILLPCAALIAFVLLLPASTRRLCVVWLASVVAGETIVATTKVLYMGWGLGIASLDFVGLSGHSTLSFLVWPVAFTLALGRSNEWRSTGIAFGTLLASVIAASRLAVHAHSVAEVVFGGILGAALSSAFLARYLRLLHVVALPRWLIITLILPFAIGYGRTVPTESILAVVARTLSGHSYVYTRADLHSGAFRSPRAGLAIEGSSFMAGNSTFLLLRLRDGARNAVMPVKCYSHAMLGGSNDVPFCGNFRLAREVPNPFESGDCKEQSDLHLFASRQGYFHGEEGAARGDILSIQLENFVRAERGYLDMRKSPH